MERECEGCWIWGIEVVGSRWVIVEVPRWLRHSRRCARRRLSLSGTKCMVNPFDVWSFLKMAHTSFIYLALLSRTRPPPRFRDSFHASNAGNSAPRDTESRLWGPGFHPSVQPKPWATSLPKRGPCRFKLFDIFFFGVGRQSGNLDSAHRGRLTGPQEPANNVDAMDSADWRILNAFWSRRPSRDVLFEKLP